MRRKRKKRRQPHGSAWHWKQTDSWYCTQPGTKKRVALFDEDGERIRGEKNKETADLALAREKLCWEAEVDGPSAGNGQWLVARVALAGLQDLDRRHDDARRRADAAVVSWRQTPIRFTSSPRGPSTQT